MLNLAGDVGEALLENGSEVYRVENSVCAVAEYFGFYPQCFAQGDRGAVVRAAQPQKFSPVELVTPHCEHYTHLRYHHRPRIHPDFYDRARAQACLQPVG